MKGTWDAIHVVEVRDNRNKTSHYKVFRGFPPSFCTHLCFTTCWCEPTRSQLTSTIMLSIETKTEATGQVTLAGSLTRQVSQRAIWELLR